MEARNVIYRVSNHKNHENQSVGIDANTLNFTELVNLSETNDMSNQKDYTLVSEAQNISSTVEHLYLNTVFNAPSDQESEKASQAFKARIKMYCIF